MRHARAASEGSDGDRARPLTAEGWRQVAVVGERLRVLGWWPDSALVSPARRAIETHAALAPAIPASIEDELYGASGSVIRERLARLPGSVTVAVIGHNPALSELASRLSGVGVALETAGAALLSHPSEVPVVALRDERRWELEHILRPYA